jgi:hypothetical protein
VGAYIRGALLQALVAGASAFAMLAILAIPCAAAIQIGVREWLAYRREEAGAAPAIAPSPSSPSAGR